MKKIALFFAAAMLMAFSAVAQEETELTEGQKAKKAATEAYNAQDYITAIGLFDTYLKTASEEESDYYYIQDIYQKSFYLAGAKFVADKDYQKGYEYLQKYQDFGREDTPSDGKFLIKFAQACSKVGKEDQAKALYMQCVALNFQADGCYSQIVSMFNKAGQTDSAKVYLQEAIEKYPDSKYHAKFMLQYQTMALKAAVVPFNEAAQWSKKAGEAGGDVKAYAANMEKACKLYKEAIPLFEEVLKYEGVDDKTKENVEKAKANIKVCQESISRFNSYRSGL